MERLTSEEEHRYESWIAATNQDDKEKNELMEGEDVAKTMEVMEKHRRCRELHGLVYDRLAEMSQLKVLDLGYDSSNLDSMFSQHSTYEVDSRIYSELTPPRLNTMELSLESALSQLSVLKNLLVFGFEGIDHRIGTKELDWMAESWLRMKIMRGLQRPE
ncbi:hypothetical protein BGZ47_005890 [Haplosporangium gracile]|nr:hypothetical protein BGZ47_005890 [Haplosporangium gracile]